MHGHIQVVVVGWVQLVNCVISQASCIASHPSSAIQHYPPHGVKGHTCPPAGGTSPHLGSPSRHMRVTHLALQVPHEPAWLSPCCKISTPAWMAFLAAAEKLMERVTAMDILLEENYQVGSCCRHSCVCSVTVMDTGAIPSVSIVAILHRHWYAGTDESEHP